MRIAAAQISCTPGDRAANLRKVGDFSARAKQFGAELIIFPEMTDTGYSMPAIREHASVWSEGAVHPLQEFAKDLSLGIICGFSERDGTSIYNAQFVVAPTGEIVRKYRKTHLITAGSLDERSVFAAGDRFESCMFGEFTFGLTICYDLRFPEVSRALALDHGANVIVNSSAWPFPRVEHLRVLALARAIENQSYLVLANRVGADDGAPFCGTSVIIDPYGVILAAASADREEIIYADISKEIVDLVRSRMRVFDHRRPDLY